MLLKSRGPAVGHQRPRAPTSSSLSAPGQPQFSTILAANLTGSNERNAAVTTGASCCQDTLKESELSRRTHRHKAQASSGQQTG